MDSTNIRVFIPDFKGGEGEWSDGPEARPISGPSADLLKELETEYGAEFHFTSIGTGAALPAFFINLVSDSRNDALALLALLYAGKPIKEGFEAWNIIAKKIASFFHRKPTLNREAAAILAYEVIVARLNGLPKTYQLIGFSTQHRLAFPDPSNPPKPDIPMSIAEAPGRVQCAFIYVFNILADGQRFFVTVDGHKVNILSEEKQP